jgi:hypothetical protein
MKNSVEQKVEAARAAIQEAADKYPGEFFTREEAAAFTGGAFGVGHLRNLDSKGDGPEESFYFGRKKVYLTNWQISLTIRS